MELEISAAAKFNLKEVLALTNPMYPLSKDHYVLVRHPLSYYAHISAHTLTFGLRIFALLRFLILASLVPPNSHCSMLSDTCDVYTFLVVLIL